MLFIQEQVNVHIDYLQKLPEICVSITLFIYRQE